MELVDLNTVNVVAISPAMSRKEKLDRLAKLAEAVPYINNVMQWEYGTPQHRDAYKLAGSIMEIASKDPVFIDAGLTGDSVGEFRKFFELREDEFHSLGCDCHHGRSARGSTYGHNLRYYANYAR